MDIDCQLWNKFFYDDVVLSSASRRQKNILKSDIILFISHSTRLSLLMNKNFIFKWLCSRSIYCLLICPLSLVFFHAYPRHGNQFMRHIVSIIIATHSKMGSDDEQELFMCHLYSEIRQFKVCWIYCSFYSPTILFYDLPPSSASSTKGKVIIENHSIVRTSSLKTI